MAATASFRRGGLFKIENLFLRPPVAVALTQTRIKKETGAFTPVSREYKPVYGALGRRRKNRIGWNAGSAVLIRYGLVAAGDISVHGPVTVGACCKTPGSVHVRTICPTTRTGALVACAPGMKMSAR